MPVQLIKGPSVKQFTREAAIRALTANPQFPEGAEFTVEEDRGQWIAAVVTAEAPPFGGGGPADSGEEAPGPKSEGPDDSEPSADDAAPKGPSDDGGDSEGGDTPPHHEHGDKGGEKGELHQVLQMLHTLMEGLGLSGDPMGGMVPGMDDGMGGGMGPGGPAGPPPPHGGHPGPAMPPHGGPGGPAGPPPPEKILHEKAGPPPPTAFSSVRVASDHPWYQTVGKISHFKVAEEISEDADLASVEGELQAIASAGGFRIARFGEARDDAGQRIAHAVIQTPQI